jgi:hypothetical protein
MLRKDFLMRPLLDIASCRSPPVLFNSQALMDQERLGDLDIWHPQL